MSTNGIESWAVDLKNIGAIYPFQGSEVLMVILGLAFWIGWHILQTRQENAEIAADMAADRSGDETRKAIGRYYS
jgi:predicted negative regulator of RcsB-dependent stress response